MSQPVYAYRISRSSVDQLHFVLPDFDSITTNLPPGLYTTFRTYAARTRVIGLRTHLNRLYLPAKAQGLSVVLNQDLLRERLADLLKPLEPDEARVRLILDTSREAGEIYILLQPLRELPPEVYQNGVRADVSRVSRDKPSLKQTAFIAESSSERKRIQAETFEILLTRRGRVLEGMTSNFFHVRDGVLSTAGRGALSGVTRQTVIDIANDADIPIRYRALPVREIPQVDEAFITSSSRGVVPVVQIDAQLVGNGRVGELTRQLMDLYQQKVLEIAEPIL
ncbi:MAG TPA: aminotransferase class IV [Anaerolineales bacterium]|nr:aminotransferase class IV [Anaerolineales bacterium]